MRANHHLFEILVVCTMSILMTLVMIAASPSTYGHTFSQNENSLFLTRVAQAHSQLNLIENLVLNGTSTTTATNNNAKSVQAHVMQTIALLNEKDLSQTLKQ